MTKLEDLKAGAFVKGIATEGSAKVINIEWHGSQAVKVIYEDNQGNVGSRIVFRNEEPTLDVVESGRPWSFDGDGHLLRLVSEAQRIRLAYLFDPYLAIHTSLIDALPHQITAVYGEMIPRQPLRFLLADDPGAGKTIMAGLLVKELMARGDLERCLVVAPGGLVEQWQDELSRKFGLSFDILSRDMVEASRSGNPFEERNLLIVRLDMLSRNEDLQAKFKAAREWDLAICDEAHRMSATFFGGEVKYTKRYHLGRTVGGHCRHFLLMSATPHNGKEEDFQLFMALLDGDRFEGRFRDGVHKSDTSDMMRRLTKEELLKFDGTPLFPERRAYTVKYELSGPEAALYATVTNYVREEMNRAERFANEDDKRRMNVGFALQILQRRLASSPAAIHESIRRRRERLENRLAEERLLQRGAQAQIPQANQIARISPEDLEDLEDAPEEEVETLEEEVLDQATAARTIAELETEIETLTRLEAQAKAVRQSGTDAKWQQLNSILDDPLMVDTDGNRRKLIVFTEPKDTLNYLADRIRTRLGRPEAVVVIHGGVGREDRRKAVESFMHVKDVVVMVANDAAGEGINLQRGHLMVNYDLPWNPNKIEQRFGRIHRIGQQEVCHLWNLVAADTREGEVYSRLLDKLETAREALGGRVYDVLGRLFEGNALRDLLLDAIRYGDQQEIRDRLFETVDGAVDQQRLLDLLADRALVHDTLGATRVAEIREAMERAEARRLQPHFIQSFFLEAFQHLGGKIHRREPGRWEITHVPGPIRERDRQIGLGEPVLPRYERICFEKDKINQSPVAAFVCPGHPLLDSTIDLILERYSELMKRGAVLIDESDDGDQVRALFYLEHAIQDGRKLRNRDANIISQRLQFVEYQEDGSLIDAGPAPYLDYRPATEDERELLSDAVAAPWLHADIEQHVVSYAIEHIVQKHVGELKARRLPEIDKVEQEVTARLKKEINHWDHRAEDLKAQERAGRKTRLSSANAAARADELADRLQRRLDRLNKERQITAQVPVVRGGAIVVPGGLLKGLRGDAPPAPSAHDALGKDEIERMAMEAVFEAERALGRQPKDVSSQRGLGYDIESKDGSQGSLVFVEVKGKWEGDDQVTITKNEILCSRNEPEKFRLALVIIGPDGAKPPQYVREFTFGEPDFGETTRTFSLKKLLEYAKPPS